jgi:hypothetical protein
MRYGTHELAANVLNLMNLKQTALKASCERPASEEFFNAKLVLASLMHENRDRHQTPNVRMRASLHCFEFSIGAFPREARLKNL